MDIYSSILLIHVSIWVHFDNARIEIQFCKHVNMLTKLYFCCIIELLYFTTF